MRHRKNFVLSFTKIYLFLYVSSKPFKQEYLSFLSIRALHFYSFIFFPEQVLTAPSDYHDKATEKGSKAHVGKVILNLNLQMAEASRGRWSLGHWKGVVEHRAGANTTASELAFEEGDELKSLLVFFLVIHLLIFFSLLLGDLLGIPLATS